MKTTILSFLLLLCSFLPATQGRQDDALDEALGLAGMRRADLGWTPKGWWPRYPDVPYKLRAFDSLFAAPLDAIVYTRALAETAYTRLDPAELDKTQGRLSTNLFQAVQNLGIDPKFGGFRGYCANVLAPDTPLDEAILALIRAGGHPTRINTFGMELPYPRPKEALAEKAKAVPADVGLIVGRLVKNIITARTWAESAFRKVDGNDRIKAARRYDVCEEMVDAYDFAPEIDDVARFIDEASLWYAGQQCVQALDNARIALAKLETGVTGAFAFDYETPWGWIRIRGTGDDCVDGRDALLIVDLGGNDTYTGEVAASTADRSIGMLLDMTGNDAYRSDGPAQGAGLCGVGILIDAAGDDTYIARRYAQGVGQFGLGLLADLGGNDSYFTRFSGQGCGYFGIGLLFDVTGDDTYKLHADGQGLGGVGGVGILADRAGNDRYTAVREHTITGRPSYHSPKLDVCVSNAQGCGMGRRGDGSDGHSWAGGLGALLDGGGDDLYRAGNWVMGTGYWFGIGLLHDRSGNDEYRGVAYSQGTGAHFCIGVHIDEEGDDKHIAEENSTMCCAWGHDFTIGIMLDAAGDDLYSVDKNGLAYSINRSVALFIDGAGNDVYRSKEVPHPGTALNSPNFRARGGVSTYFAQTTSIGLFLDADGKDTYWGDLKDNSTWLDEAGSPNIEDRNFSIGVDREGGKIDFTPVPVREPSGKRSK